MISYHPASAGAPVGTTFTAGFRAVAVDDVSRIAVCMRQFAWSQSVFKDGYRSAANFTHADWLALDFDSPDLTLKEAVRIFCDSVHVIGTTRSHQAEKNGVTCDRYRVLLRPERRILAAADYTATVRSLAKKYPIDRAATDAARHWFPCREIVSVEPDGYEIEVERGKTDAQIAAERHFAAAKLKRTGRLPRWLDRFLTDGVVCGVGRNQTIYAATIEMRQLGMGRDEIIARIKGSPFPRGDFSETEIEATVHSGFRRII